MKIQIALLLVSLLILGSTCKDEKVCHETINFKNNSSKSLYIHASGGYPDTNSFKVEFPNPSLNAQLYKVSSNASNNSALWDKSCLEYKFNTNDTLMIYVFDAEVLESTPWDTVKTKYLVLKRYDLSLDDLQRRNWTITYP
jgi:hypothetical protein